MTVFVVDLLEAVEVDEQQRQGPAAARGAFRFATQDEVEIPRVIQTGQVVGDRNRLGLLQRQGVVERDSGRLQNRSERQRKRGAEHGNRRRGGRVEAD